MKNKPSSRFCVAGILGVLSITSIHAGMPVWTYSAPNPATVTVAAGETVIVQYIVTNHSLKPKNLLLKPTPGLSASPCILPSRGSTCTLNLTVNGSQIPTTGIHGGPIFCDQGNVNQCYQPTASNQIQVNFTNNNVLLPIHFTTIGSYDNGSTLVPLAYTSGDNGATWTIANTLPPSIPATTNNVLQGISCNSSNNCAAAGSYNGSEPLTYTSSDRGVNWDVSSILPQRQGSSTQLNAISCDNSGHCATAGYFFIGFTTSALYYSSDSGDTWAISTFTNPFLGSEDVLRGITCTSSGNCAAVGYQDDGFTGRQPMFATSSNFGVSWIFSFIADNAVFFGISCNDSGNCAAVGINTLSFPQRVRVYTSNNYGQNWSLAAPLAQQGASDNSLVSISCLNSGQCAAVGSYLNAGIATPLSYISNDSGATWSRSTVLPPPQGVSDNVMNSISCLSTGMCTAVGYYSVGSTTHPLTYTSQDFGDTWAVSTNLPQIQGSGNNALNGVS